MFSCDVNQHVRATIEANFAPKVMYEDSLESNNIAAGSCDVYVACFPCQPFSLMGSQPGFKDKKKRGMWAPNSSKTRPSDVTPKLTRITSFVDPNLRETDSHEALLRQVSEATY